jgi:PAS domain S-box-containing protein
MKLDKRRVGSLAGVALVYFAAAQLGLSMAFGTRQVTAVWPPTGVAFVGYAVFGYGVWPAVALGAFVANATHSESLLTAAGISVGNTLAGVVGLRLARSIAGFHESLDRVRDVLGLAVFGAGVGSLVSATNGVINLALAGLVPWTNAPSVWWLWWVGDSLGVLLVAPLLLTWRAAPLVDARGARFAEWVALFVGLAGLGTLVFAGRLVPPGQSLQLQYVAFPFLIWAGLRFGTRETAAIAALLAALAVWGAVHDRGPFTMGTLDERLVQLDTFIAVIGVTALLVGAVTSERRRAYDTLVLRVRDRTADRFQFAIEAAPTGMIIVDRSGVIVLVNAQVERLFGHSREELVGRAIEVLVPTRLKSGHPDLRSTFFRDPKAREMGAGRDLHGLHKNGTEVPIEIGLSPFATPDGDFVLTSIVDITERKRAERDKEALLAQLRELNAALEQRVDERTAKLSASLQEREVLLQEVHHRVKNNLQVISSLINMQVRKLEDRASKEALEECQTRVQAIALIHEKLYQSRDFAQVPFSDYARSLATSVLRATGRSLGDVQLELAIEDVALPVDKAIPCGLVLNELITNALKHAFPGDRRGTIWIELARLEDGRVRLAVKDDGVGMPAELDSSKSASLGLQLIAILAEQLEGALVVSKDDRTTFEVSFPLGE